MVVFSTTLSQKIPNSSPVSARYVWNFVVVSSGSLAFTRNNKFEFRPKNLSWNGTHIRLHWQLIKMYKGEIVLLTLLIGQLLWFIVVRLLEFGILEKLTLLSISRLWCYCGPSNYRLNFLLYWYAPWVFLRSSMCFCVPHLCSKIPKMYNWSMDSGVHSVCFRGDFAIKTVVGLLVWKCGTRSSILFICNTFCCRLILLSSLYI